MKHERAYLGLRDNLFFTRLCVSTVDDADDVRLCALHQSERSPEHTLSATTCITVFRVSIACTELMMTNFSDDNRAELGGYTYNDSPVRVKETYELFLLFARIIMSIV